MPVFEKLQLWVDPVRRAGPEAMAVDEWLLETAACPVLRVYSWEGNWASLGYFGKIAEARLSFPELNLVRRWTGGGIVDHRADWTYTLVAPQREMLAKLRGAESYRIVHEILNQLLDEEGIVSRMSEGCEETGAGLCFENPVGHDLLGVNGYKLAGAGQRRSKSGLLHQGSVAISGGNPLISRKRSENFASLLSQKWEVFTAQPDPADLAARVDCRYARREWTERR